MKYILKIEGQEIPVEAEIGEHDDIIRALLAPMYPDAANSLITRVKQGDDTTIVNIAKRAGTKGLDPITPLDHLIGCAGGMNPAIEMHRKIQALDGSLDIEEALLLDEQIATAIEEGERQATAVNFAVQRLMNSRPIPAPVVIVGF